jgi:hypothetical protein
VNEQSGQATVEAVAAVPLLLAVGAVVLQLLAVGYATALADGAAEAAALALADGRPAVAAARGALPDWASERATVKVSGGEVTVRLVPPSPLPALTDRLSVSSSAFARRGGR